MNRADLLSLRTKLHNEGRLIAGLERTVNRMLKIDPVEENRLKVDGLVHYLGEPTEHQVYRNGHLLSAEPSQKVWNHSPGGFCWGYKGSGPLQLALALLLDHTRDPELAIRLHQRYKWEVVAHWPDDHYWETTSAEIAAWLEGVVRGENH